MKVTLQFDVDERAAVELRALIDLVLRDIGAGDADDDTVDDGVRLPVVAKDDVFRAIVAANREKLERGDVPRSGWTRAVVEEALEELPDLQAAVVQQAIRNGGQVSRAEVYQLGAFPADRKLRGFTRPIVRVMAQLKDAGRLPQTAEVLLVAVYDEENPTYQRTQGFTIPLEVVALMRSK
jgi:hypothetical protein